MVVSILSIVSVSSCSSYYYVVTDVNEDMAVERTVYKEAEDADSALRIDFYDQVCNMCEDCRMQADHISSLSFLPDPDQKDNPLFNPVETVSKRFRWFYTCYDYRAEFKSLKDRLPLALDGYMTPQQRALFFTGNNPPQRWNGLEMYYLLDDLNTKFARWYSDAVFIVLRDILRPYCNDGQALILDGCKDEFMKDMDRTLIFAMEPDDFVERLSEVHPDAGFDEVLGNNRDAVDSLYQKESELISYFGYSFVFNTRMPGRYYDGNAVDFIDGNPSWKVDAFRLMEDDLVLEAVTRKLNVWVFVLTFVLIILLLQLFAKVFARR